MFKLRNFALTALTTLAILLPLSASNAQTAASPTLPENFSPTPGAIISINDNTDFKWSGPPGTSQLYFLRKATPTDLICSMEPAGITSPVTIDKENWLKILNFMQAIEERENPGTTLNLLNQESVELQWFVKLDIKEGDKVTRLTSKRRDLTLKLR